MATVYIGDIPEDVRQRDVEDFFRDYKIEHVRLRDRFGFVDFRSSRDADDAVRDLDGERMLGKRVRVEISEGRRGGRGGGKVFPYSMLDRKVCAPTSKYPSWNSRSFFSLEVSRSFRWND